MTGAAEIGLVVLTEIEVAAGVKVVEVALALVDFVVAAAVVVAGEADVVDALTVAAAAGVVVEVGINGAGADYVQEVVVVVVAVVGIVAEPMGQRDSYHLDCYTAAQ